MQHRVQLHFMFSVGFHSNFIRPNIRMLEFTRGDLDHQFSDDSKFGEPFRFFPFVSVVFPFFLKRSFF